MTSNLPTDWPEIDVIQCRSPEAAKAMIEHMKAWQTAFEAMREALIYIVNDTSEAGEDAELTVAGYNKACAALALADKVTCGR